MNITLLGCGRWGSFIAWYMDAIKHNNVMVWGRENDPLLDNLIKTRKNDYVEFPESIQLTHNLDLALNHSDIIIISISAQGVRDLMSHVNKIPKFFCFIFINKYVFRIIKIIYNADGTSYKGYLDIKE